jgi:endonuclease YncB( thermonuclease family)
LRQRPQRRRTQWPAVPVLLVGAACIGLVAGAFLGNRLVESGASGTSSEIEWNSVQAVPQAAVDPGDAEWAARRAGEGNAPSTRSGRTEKVRVVGGNFGTCKWGGGTNCVVDGDTFWINGEKVRIAGIDAPETHDYGCESELALGDRATEKLQALLNSGAVTMTSIDRDRDVYGRLLRDVQVNGADVGAAMVSAGVAREYAGGRRSWC